MIHQPKSSIKHNTTNTPNIWLGFGKKAIFLALLGGSIRYNLQKENQLHPKKTNNDTIDSTQQSNHIIKEHTNNLPLQKNSFDSNKFYQTVDLIREQTIQGLKHYYHTDDVKVTIIQTTRSPEQQQLAYQKGGSRTKFGLHNLGAAADVSISIKGKIMDGTIPSRLIPYQILGYFALQQGLFWGRDGDSGHIGCTETIAGLITQYPEFIHDARVIQFYNSLVHEQQVSNHIDRRYQGFIKLYEELTGITPQPRAYYSNNLGKPRKLLSPINPYQ